MSATVWFALALLSISHAHPPLIEAELKEAIASCKDMEGQLEVGKDAVQALDLNHDGKPDYILDFAKLKCPTAPSLYSGSAGTVLHVFLTDPNGGLKLAWSKNVFGFRLQSAGEKQELHVDLKGDGADVVSLVYRAEGIRLVPVTKNSKTKK